jgi:purine-binding chemotaxis protein CheW
MRHYHSFGAIHGAGRIFMGQIIRGSQKAAAVVDDVPDKYLTFDLGKDVYALEVLRIKKIIEFGNITHVPMVPPYIRGILNLLGDVVPVVDLQICFGEKPGEISRRTCIVIVEVRRGDKIIDMGIVVDAVNNVIELLRKDIAPAPDLGDDVKTNFIHGIGKVENQFILLLDMNHVLSMEQLKVLQRIQKQAETQVLKEEAMPA